MAPPTPPTLYPRGSPCEAPPRPPVLVQGFESQAACQSDTVSYSVGCRVCGRERARWGATNPTGSALKSVDGLCVDGRSVRAVLMHLSALQLLQEYCHATIHRTRGGGSGPRYTLQRCGLPYGIPRVTNYGHRPPRTASVVRTASPLSSGLIQVHWENGDLIQVSKQTGWSGWGGVGPIAVASVGGHAVGRPTVSSLLQVQ